ncbi:polysaccharide pyruvyl transferase family protein [bacterium]|nr:MAG: polysaccharide pyruvyl transferase family protein [bacterium]
MKIGILTYHWVANFGANLQALATFQNLLKLGHDVFFFDYRPSDKMKWYEQRVPKEQRNKHEDFANKYLNLTNICHNKDDLVLELLYYKPDGVIVGSDAVFRIRKGTSDMNFPNPYWLNWVKENSPHVKTAALAVSNMGSFYLKTDVEKGKLNKIINDFDFISVRDYWTQMNIKLINPEKKIIKTYDPVFALEDSSFNDNVELSLPQEILDSNYILFSFSNGYIDRSWFDEFKKICNNNGYMLVGLPMPEGHTEFEFDYKVKYPLSPIEWYLWIKNSNGYVGERYHSVVVAIKNNVPFVSADYYSGGRLSSYGLPIKSKIFDICFSSRNLKYRYNAFNKFRNISPLKIVQAIATFSSMNNKRFTHKARISFLKSLENIIEVSKK